MASDKPKFSAFQKAFPLSFVVYLIPVPIAHFVTIWGDKLWTEIERGGDYRDPEWFALDLALAAVLQLVAWLLWFWFFRQPSAMRFVAIQAATPLFWLVINQVYEKALPRYFLIAPDSVASRENWPEECSVEDMSFLLPSQPADGSLERAGELWLRTPDAAPALLQMPGCRITAVDQEEQSWQSYVAPGGRMLFGAGRSESGRSPARWWFVDSPTSEQIQIKPPADVAMGPIQSGILSGDGSWAAWLITRSGPPGARRLVVLQPLRSGELSGGEMSSGENILFHLDRFGGSPFELLALDIESRQLSVAAYDRIFAVDLEGQSVVWGPHSVPGVELRRNGIRRIGDGWIAWDTLTGTGVAEDISWSLPAGSGSYTVLKGRRIRSVAISPGGRFIGVSVNPKHERLPDAQPSIYVFRVSNGEEIFRRYSPPRVLAGGIQFLGDEFFAYEESGAVHVLRMTASTEP